MDSRWRQNPWEGFKQRRGMHCFAVNRISPATVLERKGGEDRGEETPWETASTSQVWEVAGSLGSFPRWSYQELLKDWMWSVTGTEGSRFKRGLTTC